MKKTKIILSILFLFYVIFVFLSSLGQILPSDSLIYSDLSYKMLNGNIFGLDFVDTKFSPFFWCYAVILKVFTYGLPYSASIEAFNFVSFFGGFFAIWFAAIRLFKRFWTIFLTLLIYVFVVLEFEFVTLDSTVFDGIFIAIAIGFFVNKKGEYGKSLFWVGVFVGIAGFIKLPALVNFVTFPLTMFIVGYNTKNNFITNIKKDLQKNLKQYLFFTLGVFLPWGIYFIDLSITHTWQAFFNYINYVHYYSSIKAHIQSFSYVFLRPKFILLHAFLIISFIVLIRDKSKNYSKPFNIFVLYYFFINAIFSYALIPSHLQHYYIQTMFIFPFVMSKAVYIALSEFKQKHLKGLKIILSLFFMVMAVWFGVILKVRNYYSYDARMHGQNTKLGAKDYYEFLLKSFKTKSFTWKNYLELTDKWRYENPIQKIGDKPLLDALKPYYSGFGEKKVVLFSVKIPTYIMQYNYFYTPEFDFIEMSSLEFYKKRGMPIKAIGSTSTNNVKEIATQSFFNRSPLLSALLKNNWENQYTLNPGVKTKLSDGSTVYIWVWTLKKGQHEKN